MASQASQSTCLVAPGHGRKLGPPGPTALQGAWTQHKPTCHATSSSITQHLSAGSRVTLGHQLYLARGHMAGPTRILLQLVMYAMQLVTAVCQKVLPIFSRLKGMLWVLGAKLLSSRRGRLLLAAIAAVACVRVSFSSSVAEDDPTTTQVDDSGSSRKARAVRWPCLHTYMHISVLWDCLRLQAHLQFRYPRWLPQIACQCFGSMHSAVTSTYRHIVPAAPRQQPAAADQKLPQQQLQGSTTVLLQEEDGKEVQVQCTPELTRTILRFLEDQQQRTPGCQVFKIRSPHKGDGEGSLFNTPVLESRSSGQLLATGDTPLGSRSQASSTAGLAHDTRCAGRAEEPCQQACSLQGIDHGLLDQFCGAAASQVQEDDVVASCSQASPWAADTATDMPRVILTGSMADSNAVEVPGTEAAQLVLDTNEQCSSPTAQMLLHSPSLCSTRSMSPQDAAARWHTRFERGGSLTARYDTGLDTSASSQSSRHVTSTAPEGDVLSQQLQDAVEAVGAVTQAAVFQVGCTTATAGKSQPQHLTAPLSSSFVQGLAARSASQIPSAALRYACRMAALAATEAPQDSAGRDVSRGLQDMMTPPPAFLRHVPEQGTAVRPSATPQLRLLVTRPVGAGTSFNSRSVDASTSPFSSSAIQAALRVPQTHTRQGAPETAAALAVARAARSRSGSSSQPRSSSSMPDSIVRQQQQEAVSLLHSRRASADSSRAAGESQQRLAAGLQQPSGSTAVPGAASSVKGQCNRQQLLTQLHSWDTATGPCSRVVATHVTDLSAGVARVNEAQLSGPFGSTELAAAPSYGLPAAVEQQQQGLVTAAQQAEPISPTSQSPFASASQLQIPHSSVVSPSKQQQHLGTSSHEQTPTSGSSPAAPPSPATSSAASAHSGSSSYPGSSLLSFESATSQQLLERSSSKTSLGGRSAGEVGPQKGLQSSSRASTPGSRSGRKPTSTGSMSRRGSMPEGEDHHPLTRPMSSSLTFGGVLF